MVWKQLLSRESKGQRGVKPALPRLSPSTSLRTSQQSQSSRLLLFLRYHLDDYYNALATVAKIIEMMTTLQTTAHAFLAFSVLAILSF